MSALFTQFGLLLPVLRIIKMVSAEPRSQRFESAFFALISRVFDGLLVLASMLMSISLYSLSYDFGKLSIFGPHSRSGSFV